MPNTPPNPAPEQVEMTQSPRRTLLGRLVAVIASLVSLLYLVNPGAGVLELIPDNLPGVGNLDEAFFVAVLIAAMRYLGIDLLGVFQRRNNR